jgi:Ca-activated chloride channel family protein
MPRLLRSPRARRGIAASAIVLSLGGLVLFHAPAGADPTHQPGDADYLNGTSFAGPGARGTFSLSHGKVLADGRQRVFAELRVRADETEAVERAPLSIAIVLDTSGSMDGDKLAEARRSVIRMLDQMRPDDEVAFVRYDSHAHLMQPMARVSDVRGSLVSRIQDLYADGGTNIPAALRTGLSALDGASSSRVKRLVLVSDGLDGTRNQSEALASNATDAGVTVSSLGIGLDFDEAYMSGVARAGRGNFGFVKNASSLAKFLQRELEETASTSVEGVTARVRLPRHLRLRRAVGADVRELGRGDVELRIGSLFSGDERRIVLELEADAPIGEQLAIDTNISWRRVAGGMANLDLEQLQMVASDDDGAVLDSRDNRVWSSGISAIASLRQMEAAEAYAKGDVGRADKLIQDNLEELDGAADAAPPAMAAQLREQKKGYAATKGHFQNFAPSSAEGRAAAKESAAQDAAHLNRDQFGK